MTIAPRRRRAGDRISIEIHNHAEGSTSTDPDPVAEALARIEQSLGAFAVAVEDIRVAQADLLGRLEAVAEQQFDGLRLLRRVTRTEKAQMVKFADLQAELEAQSSVTQSILALVDRLLEAADNGSDAELQTFLDGLRANREAMAAAVVKGTPVEGEAPAEPPPVVEPAPEAPPGPAPDAPPPAEGTEPAAEPPAEPPAT